MSKKSKKTRTNNIAKWNLKDSVFTYLFSKLEYACKLYSSLTGEDIREDEIRIATLENVFCNGIYNDIGILAHGTELYLIEAQSTGCINIPFRFNDYYMETIKRLVPGYESRQYGKNLIKNIPCPHFKVIYTGKDPMPDYIDTEVTFFSGQSLRIRVEILTKDNSDGIIRAYCIFAEKYDEYVALYGRSLEAVNKTIEYALKSRDTFEMRDFLLKNKREVETIMTSYNKQKRILISWGNEMKEEGREEGRVEGREEGRVEGREEGRVEGREEGRVEGREKTLSAVRDYFSRSGFSEDLQKEVLKGIVASLG